MSDAAIVVQAFNKTDTLQNLFTSLLSCSQRKTFDLIIWLDSPKGGRRESEFLEKCKTVDVFVENFAKASADQFHSITIKRNSENMGTCRTCELSIDFAFQSHEFVIFTEDDTIFAPDALDWFIAIAATPTFLADDVWAIAGESIFFDAERAAPDAGLISDAKLHAITHRLWEQFIPLDWIPSTCFATNREKWRQYSVTRGKPCGDVDLCLRCRHEGKKCLFPVVARVKDIGMLHPDGYSVTIHTAEKVSSVKNTYLTSADVNPGPNAALNTYPFTGDAGLLYFQSSKMNGFENVRDPEVRTTVFSVERQNELLQEARQAGLRENWNVALDLWRELKNGGCSASEVDTNIALCLLKCGDNNQARTVIQSVLIRDPEDAYAQSIMAYIFEAGLDLVSAGYFWYKLCQRDDLPGWLADSAAAGYERCHRSSVSGVRRPS